MFYDFIEIGTSDLCTEIQKTDEKIGISIEIVKYYLDKLPNKQNCIKLNMGISDHNGNCKIHYIPEYTLLKYNLPTWVKGSICINSYHPLVMKVCKEMNLNIEDLAVVEEIELHTLHYVMDKYQVEGLYFLKIDTEGHDCVILNNFFKNIRSNKDLPFMIMFESNILSNPTDVDTIIQLYGEKGYDLVHKDESDSILLLNLKRLQNKSQFTNGIKNYFIYDYPPNYSITNLPHDNSLEGAKEYCIAHNCSGVTLENGIFQVRNGANMNYVKNDTLISWVYC